MLKDNDRLMTAFFVAIILHGLIILGITFDTVNFKQRGSDQLEVVLIQGQSDDLEPDNAAYYAQTNQRGSGNTDEQVHASSDPTQGDLINNRGKLEQSDLLERDTISDESMRQYLASRRSNKQSVLIQAKPESTTSERRMQARLMLVGEQILAPQNTREDKNKITHDSERELFVSIDAKQSDVANYISAWRSKVERIGTLNYPKNLLQKNRQRSPVVEVSIARNGSIRTSKILRSSGSNTTDQAALRILRLAAPFDPFPKELAVGKDAMSFVYEWHFSSVGQVKGRALLGKQ